MEEGRRPLEEFEMNVRLVLLEYILEFGSMKEAVESLYNAVKGLKADDWYTDMVLQKARDFLKENE